MSVATTFDECWLEDANGCYVWQRAFKGKEAASGGGYGCLRIKGKLWAAHRYAWEREHGPIPAGLQIRHKCHNTKCVNTDHMELGSNADNAKDKALALRASGYKLSPDDVRSIRTRREAGEKLRTIAADFGIDQTYVSQIARRVYRQHVE